MAESTEDIWKEDKLGRKDDAELIRQFLIGQLDIREQLKQPRTFVLNIDSGWGGGKTFFLQRLKTYLEEKNHISVYINAWEDDYSDDPLIAVISAIKEQFENHLEKNDLKKKIKGRFDPIKNNVGKLFLKTSVAVAKHTALKVVGEEGLNEIAIAAGDAAIDSIGSDLLQIFDTQKATVQKFKNELEKLTASILGDTKANGPLFVLIDELDRCRPDYAIKLLERVKHLFSVENIVFVVATDTKQLSHAVSGTYGHEFDGTRYLKRFFDRTYTFAEVSKENFIESTFLKLGLSEKMFSVPPNQNVTEFLAALFSLPDIELRDIKQMLEVLQTFVSVWEHREVKVNLTYLIPLIYNSHRFGSMEISADNPMNDIVVEHNYFDGSGRKHRTTRTKVSRFNAELLKYSPDIFSSKLHANGAIIEWVSHLYSEEQSKIHNNRHVILNPTPSVILNYPSFLGRLSKLAEPEDE